MKYNDLDLLYFYFLIYVGLLLMDDKIFALSLEAPHESLECHGNHGLLDNNVFLQMRIHSDDLCLSNGSNDHVKNDKCLMKVFHLCALVLLKLNDDEKMNLMEVQEGSMAFLMKKSNEGQKIQLLHLLSTENVSYLPLYGHKKMFHEELLRKIENLLKSFYQDTHCYDHGSASLYH